MNTLTVDRNRPVHLARRDAFFERGMEWLYTPVAEMDAGKRLVHVAHAIVLLGVAEEHATYASRCARATAEERDFLHFLKLIAGNLRSVHSMTQHESHLEGEQGFLARFLGTSAEEAALPALHYRRRADDILQGIWHLLRLAHKPYRVLQKASLEQLDAEESARYQKAYESFTSEAHERAG